MKGFNKNLKKNILYLSIFLVIVLFLIGTFFPKKTVEPFSFGSIGKSISGGFKSVTDKVTGGAGSLNPASDIQNMVNSAVNSAIGGVKNELTNQINNVKNDILSTIAGQFQTIIKQLQYYVQTYFIQKITSIFSQLGGILNNGIVNPIKTLFVGIGDIFMQIFNILKQLANKIASLPGCIPFYMIDTSIDMINQFIRFFIPGFIVSFFSTLYDWTLGIFVNWLLDVTGWNAADRKCYNFNVNSEIQKMNQDAQDIGRAFASGFGNLNFASIRF